MVWGNYEVRDVLASGPRTTVFRVRRKGDALPLLIKTVNSEYASGSEQLRIKREAEFLRDTAAPGVIELFELEQDEGRPLLVLQDMGGAPLGGRGPMSLPEFFQVAEGITTALCSVHANYVVHRDIKPDNVLFNASSGEIRLVDFGSAVYTQRDDIGRSIPPVSGELVGSSPYFSPEQTGRINRVVDYRTDYYALGITFFELLAGRRPYEAVDLIGWVHCHLSQPIPRLHEICPAVPLAVSAIVYKLMAKDPDARYQSGYGILSDLSQCRQQFEDGISAEAFEAGGHDVSEVLRMPTVALGRDLEAARLWAQFQQLSAGEQSLVLVSGPLGIGKSLVLNTLQFPVVASGASFLQASFSSQDQAVPYSAIVKALSAFFKEQLRLPETELRHWQQSLQASLGDYCTAMSELIPVLGQLLPEQPKFPPSQRQGSLSRFRQAFSAILGVLARADCPVVMVLDDLQWADASSLELLSSWCTANGGHSLLLVVAYRDSETEENLPLVEFLRHVRASVPSRVFALPLQPLPIATLQQWGAAVTGGDESSCLDLAHLLEQKTGGIPLFVASMLRQMESEGVLVYAHAQGRWLCDLLATANMSVSENIIDVMVGQLQGLQEGTLTLLKAAACLPKEFSESALLELMGQGAEASSRDFSEGISEALSRGYLVKASSKQARCYCFEDSRIRRVLYRLLPLERREVYHWKIGRFMQALDRDDQLLTTVNHLNNGRGQVANESQWGELSLLNQRAAIRAMKTAAYPAALGYWSNCLEFLDKASSQLHLDHFFEISLAQVQCQFLQGDTENAEHGCDRLLNQTEDPQLRARVLFHRAKIAERGSRDLLETLRILREALGGLGLELPQEAYAIACEIELGLATMGKLLQTTPLADVSALPLMEDTRIQLMMDLLSHSVPCAIQSNPPLFIFLELKMFELTMRYGVTEASCKNLMDCAIVQGGVLQDYKQAYAFGEQAFALVKRLAPTPVEASVQFVFAVFVEHWRGTVASSLAAFDRSVNAAVQWEDRLHLLYARVHQLHRVFYLGQDLSTVETHLVEVTEVLEQAGAPVQLLGARLVQWSVDALTTELEDSGGLEQCRMAQWETIRASGNAQWEYTYAQLSLTVSVLLRDSLAAENWLKVVLLRMSAGSTLYSVPETVLCHSLVLGDRWPSSSERQKLGIQAVLTDNLEKLQLWSAGSPENFGHKYSLLQAEWARLHGESVEKVVHLYEESVSLAGEHFIQWRAFALERYSFYWNSLGNRRLAKPLIRDAYCLYDRWGATQKIQRLARAFPDWCGEGNLGAATGLPAKKQALGMARASFDLTAVLTATQAISREVETEKLFATLMDTILENAGAQRGFLVLRGESGELQVVAKAAVQVEVEVQAAVSRERPGQLVDHQLCWGIVRYVARTGERLVLGDARTDPNFQNDPYVIERGLCSVLCVPIMAGGQLSGVLYAENNAITCAFVPERLAAVQMIASQAAISIKNARQYDGLAEMVAKRTAELREKTEGMQGLLSNVQQGLFTLRLDGTIHPEYSKYLESLLETNAIAGHTVAETLFQHTDLSTALVDRALGILGQISALPAFLFEANRHCLPREFSRKVPGGERKLLAVEWNVVADSRDNVSAVLVTVRDNTELRALQIQTAKQRERMAMVEELLALSNEEFSSFAVASLQLISSNEKLLEQHEDSAQALAQVFRNTHTIKSNAAVYGLSGIVAAAHDAEDNYRVVQIGSLQARSLMPQEKKLRVVVELYQNVHQEHLAQRASSKLPALCVEELQALLAAERPEPLSDVALAQALELLLQEASDGSLSSLLFRPMANAKKIAKELGKIEPEFVVDAPDLLLPAHLRQTLRDVFAHVFRNTVDHGIDTGAERLARGLPQRGTIEVVAMQSEETLTIRVSDDGKGLAVRQLREKLQALNNVESITDDQAAESVFEPGITTAAQITNISGRGVGMNAIRVFLRAIGGDASVRLLAAVDQGYAPFELILTCPLKLDGKVEQAADSETRLSKRCEAGGGSELMVSGSGTPSDRCR